MAERVNVRKSFANVNESLIRLFDESGVRRSFTVPYIDGQDTADHIKSVSAAAGQAGGLGNNLLMTAHHSEGKGFGTGDGHTVAHPVDKLWNAVIPADDKNAKAAIDAAQTHINNVGKLIGDNDPAVKTADGQLALVKKTDAAGMNLFHFGVFLTQILHPVNQAIARASAASANKGAAIDEDEESLSGATGPGEAPEDTEASAGGEEKEGSEQEAPAQGKPPAGGQEQAAPEAQAAPAGAPAAPQAQG